MNFVRKLISANQIVDHLTKQGVQMLKVFVGDSIDLTRSLIGFWWVCGLWMCLVVFG